MGMILVTGGSGFIAGHCILQLLSSGKRVRISIRSLEREHSVRATLAQGGADPRDRISFAVADLQNDAGWSDAVAGCEGVLHVASPFPLGAVKHEDEIIGPAREGTLRVLRASRDAGVKRVVLTSSFAAIGYGQKPQHKPFDETNWSNVEGRVSAYVKSKTLAERAAWNFISEEGAGLELCVVNPVAVLGPVLGPDYSTSIHLVKRMLDGCLPAAPKLNFGVVDVRDVADLHLRAMTNPAARGERFLAAAGDFMSFLDIAKVLRNRMGAAARRAPTWELPNWVLRAAAIGSATAREILPELDKNKNGTNDKAKRLLGWAPCSNEECIVAAAESLIRLRLLRN